MISGREADQVFEPGELLYIRFADVDGDGRPAGADIRCPDLSVNREKYSNAEDVLAAEYPKFKDFGYGSFRVDQIPKVILDGLKVEIAQRVEHDPTQPPRTPDENYSHCEIRSYKDEIRKTPKVSDSVRKQFRIRLAESIDVIRRPKRT
jgi:hypothetical protein